MLKINFLPDSNLRDYSGEIAKYEKLWVDEGERIVRSIEKVSNLKFQETEINAIIYYGSLPSRSRPLSLIIKESRSRCLSILIHELTHRIISGNVRRKTEKRPTTTAVHKLLDLILYDIWTDLYGQSFADSAVQWEKKIPRKGYKESWEWALSFDKEERIEKFKDLLYIRNR